MGKSTTEGRKLKKIHEVTAKVAKKGAAVVV